MSKVYDTLPSLPQWKQDSSVTFAIRSSDMILGRIDQILGVIDLNKSEPVVFNYALADLYFTVEYWLRNYRRVNMMCDDRQPAVYSLWTILRKELCKVFQCTNLQLDDQIKEMYGRDLSDVGIRKDFQECMANYLERAEIAPYRMKFREGKIYQYKWWSRSSPNKIVPASSYHAYNPEAFVKQDGAQGGYGPFVMTMEREFYMMRHEGGTMQGRQDGIYHSSYLKGETVMCAGSMFIVNGILKRVRSDSGHYKPTESNMVAFLQALQMFRIPLKDVWVESFDGKKVANAIKFLQAFGNWDLLKTQKLIHQSDNYFNDQLKTSILNPLAPNPALVPQQQQQQLQPPPPTNNQSGTGSFYAT